MNQYTCWFIYIVSVFFCFFFILTMNKTKHVRLFNTSVFISTGTPFLSTPIWPSRRRTLAIYWWQMREMVTLQNCLEGSSPSHPSVNLHSIVITSVTSGPWSYWARWSFALDTRQWFAAKSGHVINTNAVCPGQCLLWFNARSSCKQETEAYKCHCSNQRQVACKVYNIVLYTHNSIWNELLEISA